MKMLARSTRIKKKPVYDHKARTNTQNKKEAYVLLCMLSILSHPPRIIVGIAFAHQQKCYIPFLSLSLSVSMFDIVEVFRVCKAERRLKSPREITITIASAVKL